MSLPSWCRVLRALPLLLATAASGSPPRPAPRLSVEGVVVASSGLVPDIEVRATLGEQRVTTRTDPQGHFVFKGLSEGWGWKLAASRGEERGERGIEESSGAVKRFVLELGPPRTLKGLVRAASGMPMKGAKVQAGLHDGHSSALPHSTLTGEDGQFEIPMTGFSPATVHISAPEHLELSTVHVPSSGKLDVTLQRAETLRGHITDHSGAPLAGVIVRLKRFGQLMFHMNCVGNDPLTTRTGSAGTFELQGLEPGRYVFFLDPQLHNPLMGTVEVPSGDVRWILSRGTPVRVVLSPPNDGKAKDVAILDGAAQKPNTFSSYRYRDVDDSGTVTFDEVAAGAAYWMKAERTTSTESRAVARRLQVSLDSENLVRADFGGPHSLRLRLVDSMGRPVRGDVTLEDPTVSTYSDRHRFRLIRKMPSHAFDFTGLPDGPLRVSVSAPGFEDPAAEVALPQQQTLRLVLKRKPREPRTPPSPAGDATASGSRAQAKRVLTGRVETPDGRGLAGADVRCIAPESHPEPGYADCHAYSLPEGSVYLSEAPSGDFDLVISHRDWPRARVSVAAGVASFQLRLTPGLTLHGRVQDPEGRRLERGQIEVTMGKQWYAAPIHDDGTYEIRVPPGEGTVAVLNRIGARLQPFSGREGERVRVDVLAPPGPVLGGLAE
ncbi:carboxypeptidase-like regulatory domain-containing protein [Myxococcus sp. K15C18031901]|uniref:carboxypeptidase-like regulatory domain-containing protein n=1 Tax=Myxococcus dinghuensis TaxID=2906761 RepID=UPI0020A70A6A|nr:carboxypeptidase-like regulatory domain-containing protein [Myxococcus dinghuensis]MCP3103511.1 carboxypeptidase-like regulatory domain-containing protein [Myxococcus dinghuensis]